MGAVMTVDIGKVRFTHTAHYNMGKAGYGNGWRCIEEPRLGVIDLVYRPAPAHPDGKIVRTWSVDGVDCPSLDAALDALMKPPELTDDEKRVLDLIPQEFAPLRVVEDDLAGCSNPKGAIMPDTPHSRVIGWIGSLAAKGKVEYGRLEGRSDGEPWSMRWSPAIRRRK
jgi:hypothetical protein